jgi:hypothetical protein
MYIVEISVKRLIFYTPFSLFEEKRSLQKKLLGSMYLYYYLTSYRKSLKSETMTMHAPWRGGESRNTKEENPGTNPAIFHHKCCSLFSAILAYNLPFFCGTPVVRVTGLKRTSDLIRITVEGDKEYNGKASMYYFSMGEDGIARSLV